MKHIFHQLINKKTVLLLVVLMFCSNISLSQRFFSVVFDNLPKDQQLYARNDRNEAVVPINGIIELTDWSYFSVVVSRNKQRYAYSRSKLVYDKGIGKFSMNSVIRAELADYDFDVYACRTSTDSILVVSRKDVVSGDVYLVHGQSNAIAIKGGTAFASKYCRTIGLDNLEDRWITPFQITNSYWWSGSWANENERLFVEKRELPICIINAAVPGTKIREHNIVNNPRDLPGTLYGNLLYRVKQAGITRIRAFFWYQGENDVFDDPNGYGGEFNKLANYWQIDYPMVEQFIIIQINILNTRFYEAGNLRDFQRRTKYIYPKFNTFATIGVTDDGVHYSKSQYQEFGRRIYHVIAPRVYGLTDTYNISCPDIQKVFYSSSKKDEITLEFDSGQEMRWPNDTIVKGSDGNLVKLSLNNYLYLDGNENKSAEIISSKVEGNRIAIKLKSTVSASKLNYLPSYYIVPNLPFFIGPYLINKNGLPAFSFHEVAIQNALNSTELKAEATDVNSIKLSWSAVAGADYYLLERKDGIAYRLLKKIDTQTKEFTESGLKDNTSYMYRIKAVSQLSESAYSEATARTFALLSVSNPQNPMLIVYPNPVSETLTIQFPDYISGSLSISNSLGQRAYELQIKNQNKIEIPVKGWEQGSYIIQVDYGLSILSKKIKLLP